MDPNTNQTTNPNTNPAPNNSQAEANVTFPMQTPEPTLANSQPYTNPTQTPPPPPIENTRHFNVPKVILIVAGAIFVILLLSLGVLLKNKFSKPAVPPDVLLATVGDQKIYKSDIGKAALEQYRAPAITKDILKTFLNTLIEQKILDIEASKQKISVSNEEVNAKLVAKNNLNNSPIFKKQQYYSILKEKIISADLSTRDAFVIDFWIPPYFYPNSSSYESRRADANKALNEILIDLKNGEVPLQVARKAFVKYPSLSNTFNINGYQLKRLKNESLVANPRTYTFAKESKGSFQQDALFSLKTGEIKRFDGPDGSGGSVISIIKAKDSNIQDYNEWLKKKKQELVIINNPI